MGLRLRERRGKGYGKEKGKGGEGSKGKEEMGRDFGSREPPSNGLRWDRGKGK